MLTISFSRETSAEMPRRTWSRICGLTQRTITSASRETSPFSPPRTPYDLTSSCTRSGRRALTKICSDRAAFVFRRPLSNASPMLPAPMNPSVLSVTIPSE